VITRLRHLIPVLLAGAIASCLSAGVAAAYWTATGEGSGSTGTATMTAVATVEPSTPLTSLSPGQTADLVLRLTNSNGYPVKLYSVAANGPVTATGAGTCTTTGVTFTPPSGASLTAFAPLAASSSTDITLTAAVAMSLASDSGCQGARFTIPVTVTVR
jgi:hypothetical protein